MSDHMLEFSNYLYVDKGKFIKWPKHVRIFCFYTQGNEGMYKDTFVVTSNPATLSGLCISRVIGVKTNYIEN